MRVTLVASVLLEHNGKYLLVQQARSRRQPGKWGPPGGKPEQGETLFEAAIRETLEETGLQIELDGFVGLLRSGHREIPNIFVCFGTRLPATDASPELHLREGEISGGRWLTLEEIESDALPLRSAPFKALYRRFHSGQLYPLEVVEHEVLDAE